VCVHVITILVSRRFFGGSNLTQNMSSIKHRLRLDDLKRAQHYAFLVNMKAMLVIFLMI